MKKNFKRKMKVVNSKTNVMGHTELLRRCNHEVYDMMSKEGTLL